jgi:uncharacterized membrane protein YbhN (UPF0104 family)
MLWKQMLDSRKMTPEDNNRSSVLAPFVKNVLKVVLVLTVLYFVWRQLALNWDEVAQYDWVINYSLLLLSVLLHLVTFVLFSSVWCFLISGFGYRVSLRHGFMVQYITNLGRYVPGKIWPVFGMLYLAKRIGVKEEAAVTSWVIAQVFAIPAAFLTGLACLLFLPETAAFETGSFVGLGVYLVAASSLVMSLLLLFAPNRMFYLFNIVLKLLKRSPVTFQLSIATAFKVYFGYFICWLCYGLSFWVFLQSIASGSDIPLIPSMGAFIIAYQVGYLAMFSPGGLGVRELVLSTLLMPYLGPLAAGVAVAARIWNILAEIMAFFTAWRIKASIKN